jgi:hypothetical protein
MNSYARRKQLREIDNAAFFFAGDNPKPAASVEIGGRVFSVQYHVVNRKCHDSLATPTAMYKIDGKRVSRTVFYTTGNGA